MSRTSTEEFEEFTLRVQLLRNSTVNIGKRAVQRLIKLTYPAGKVCHTKTDMETTNESGTNRKPI
ncbi:hypothetical protein KIN20_034998 [Parelaphostrongylus tenuis]|uniref:Uncharacterized protein n=1 Tax=Parelaphostrongylus tenuis TaxID=148309 RepID=A0AAD5RB79_PARTN|nr:hypothetical protein KIN20_034998 [Parelaphostrongylus tenuis]